MSKERVIYEIKKGNENVIVTKNFNNIATACSYFNEIKNKAVSPPIIETINERKK